MADFNITSLITDTSHKHINYKILPSYYFEPQLILLAMHNSEGSYSSLNDILHSKILNTSLMVLSMTFMITYQFHTLNIIIRTLNYKSS